MAMIELRCPQCARHLAMADERCSGCGAAVPPALRKDAYLAKAEAHAEAGQYAEAARNLDVPIQGSEPQEAKLLNRKKGIWIIKSGQASLLDAAEAALAEALRLDDSDDLSHQLWVDLLRKRGQVEKARAWYAHRLQLDPQDAMAARQARIIKLGDDFKAAPPPKLDLGARKGGFLAKALAPTGSKVAFAWLGLLSSLAMTAYSLVPGEPPDVSPEGLQAVGAVSSLLQDPWIPGIQAAFCAAYLWWARQETHG